ncbi:MAG: hypothetical protein JST00_12020 [Deltaproteobacteria bacterium]|nr:hypothetical protein [Deltaproteobacteria bacterium]
MKLTGGTCNKGRCIGDDVEMGGFGNFGKAGKACAWYLSLIDSANTLGYENVTLTATAQ